MLSNNNEKNKSKEQSQFSFNNAQGRSQNMFQENKNFINNFTDVSKSSKFEAYGKNSAQHNQTRQPTLSQNNQSTYSQKRQTQHQNNINKAMSQREKNEQ